MPSPTPAGLRHWWAWLGLPTVLGVLGLVVLAERWTPLRDLPPVEPILVRLSGSTVVTHDGTVVNRIASDIAVENCRLLLEERHSRTPCFGSGVTREATNVDLAEVDLIEVEQFRGHTMLTISSRRGYRHTRSIETCDGTPYQERSVISNTFFDRALAIDEERALTRYLNGVASRCASQR